MKSTQEDLADVITFLSDLYTCLPDKMVCKKINPNVPIKEVLLKKIDIIEQAYLNEVNRPKTFNISISHE